MDWLDFREVLRNNIRGYDISPLFLCFPTSDVQFSTISMDLKGFDNNLKNIEKNGNSKSWNTKYLLIIAVSVCRPECGRSRETLQTALESCIL